MSGLQVTNLHKKYGSVHAVRGVSFEIKKGICFGFLGMNGAGKSTIIEILEGIKEPTSGKILFEGRPRKFSSYKEKIGVQFQSTALQDYMRVSEALKTFAALYKDPGLLEDIIRQCRLQSILNRYHKNLSGGQRKRLLLALALINNPELVFLDEPTAGLDPASRKLFWKLIKSIKEQKKTIIFSSHYMDEVYELCDEILILNEGQIVKQGSPRLLLDQFFKGQKKLCLPLSHRKYFNEKFPHPFQETKTHIEFQTLRLTHLIRDLLSHNIPIESMEVRPPTLDDLFEPLQGEGL